MYKWQQVKALQEKGTTIKAIVRQLGMSKNTVRKYLKQSDPPKFKKRDYEKELAKYEDQVREMIRKGYIGTRIKEELSALGYQGSLSSVHRYISHVREKEQISGKATTRFETLPGRQMQYDWKEWDLPVGGKLLPIYIHEVILSYSRYKYYTYSLSIKTQDVVRAIEQSFFFFGGLAQTLVIDNPKQMVITHEKSGIVRYNDEFLKFCGMYGIEPDPCRNYRPRTKGKVERPFYYIQEHLLRGLEVKDLAEFELKLAEIMQTYNNRPHSTLHETPQKMFLNEKNSLKPIPKVEPAVLYQRPPRTVSNDGYISYNGGYYPVPMKYCLKDLTIEPLLGRALRIYDKGQLLKEYAVNPFEKGKRPVHPEHEEINTIYLEKKEAQKSTVVANFVETFKCDALLFVEGLKTKVGANFYWHLSEIMKYTEIYPIDTVSKAISDCVNIGAYHKNSLKRILVNHNIGNPDLDLPGHPIISNCIDITRPLSEYKVGGAQ